MTISTLKKFLGWFLLSSLLFTAACSTLTTSKPYSELTPEEREQLDPLYWKMMGTRSGLGG